MKVCNIFLTFFAIILLIDNLKVTDVIVFAAVFIITTAIVYVINYFKYQKQKRELDYLILSLEKCIKQRQNTQ